MSDHDIDPFEESDEAARARAERRRRRDERRRVGNSPSAGRKTRRSLGERVSAVRESLPPIPSPSSSAARGSLDEEGAAQPGEDHPTPDDDAPLAGEHDPVDGEHDAPAPVPGERDAPLSDEHQPVTGDHPPITDEGDAGGSDSKEWDATAAVRSRSPRSPEADVRRRRLAAVAAVVGVLLAGFLVLRAAGGGDGEEEQPVAEDAVPVFSLTIPEGLTREQIADLVNDERRVRGNYERATRNFPRGFNASRYGAEDADDLEGFLFPATYELERRAPASDLVDRQLEAFEENMSGINMRPARRANLTPYDVVIIASMIEREISVPEERRLAAAVIYNRLADGEPLGIDATLRYELDNFDQPLLQSELDSQTPYNTRINAGLPPGPIGNPGLASLEAAAKPANSDVRYYVIKPGTCNEHLFTDSAAEFERAVAEYQAALEEQGGSPTEC